MYHEFPYLLYQVLQTIIVFHSMHDSHVIGEATTPLNNTFTTNDFQ